MRNFIAVIFDASSAAYDGLRELWKMDREAEITVHGTAVVHRDSLGQLIVDTKETYPGLATAIGVGVGALLGALAGPAGAAAGAAGAAAIAGGAAVGAAAGGTAGLIADIGREDVQAQAKMETRFVLRSGQHAIIADVTEDWTKPIDTQMQRLGGKVYRRPRSDLEDDAWFGSYYPYDQYLYPYEYRPDPTYYLY